MQIVAPTMEVKLAVYDLSGGLARQLSMSMLGFRLDAIYHTSIILSGLEWVYDGNIVAIQPFTSHLGRPMEVLHLGETSLPMDIVEEYIDSIRGIFTVEVSQRCAFGRSVDKGSEGGPSDHIPRHRLISGRHMTCSDTTATTSQTTLRHSCLAKASQNTSPTCPRPCWSRRSAR